MPDAKTLSTKRLLDGWLPITEGEIVVQLPDGTYTAPMNRTVADNGDAAGALLFDADQIVFLLVRQYRYALERHGDAQSLEIVAGKLDPGETPEQTIRREIMEEVGHRVGPLEPICPMYSSPGMLAERVDLFYGEISAQTKRSAGGGDETEILDLVEVPVGDAMEMTRNGQIKDAKTLIAILWWRSRFSQP